MVPFSVEELTFLQHYKAATINETCQKIKQVLPVIDEQDMKILASSVLTKVKKLSEDEFNKINFENVLDLSSDIEIPNE